MQNQIRERETAQSDFGVLGPGEMTVLPTKSHEFPDLSVLFPAYLWG